MAYIRIKNDTNSLDLTGLTFGKLTVLNKTENRLSHGSIIWECKCYCGKVVFKSAKDLRRAKWASCGCYRIPKKHIDILGKKYNKLLVIERTSLTRNRAILWRCICDCGNEKLCRSADLRIGSVKSCGCVGTNYAKGDKNIRRINKIWNGMLRRCYNPSTISFHLWGGSGVRVCDEWKTDFMEFAKWSLANGYAPKLTIDRYPNQNGDYSPENCRWATMKEQGNNRRGNIVIEYQGQKKTISEWAELKGIPYFRLAQRIMKLKWSPVDAIERPNRRKKI